MKTESKISVGSLSIVKAVEEFKTAYLEDSTVVSICSASSSKRDRSDKGNFSISFLTDDIKEVPYFLEKSDYTDNVRTFFADKLKREIKFLELSWSLNNKSFDLSIALRF